MSRGQLPRTREFFPRMKVRGGRRRAAQRGVVSVDLSGVFESMGRFAVQVGRVVAVIAEAAGSLLANAAHLVLPGFARLAVEAEEARAREYVLSERFQLDQLAHRYEGRPLEHSAAVGRFFEARAHRELDVLAHEIRVRPLHDALHAVRLGRRSESLGALMRAGGSSGPFVAEFDEGVLGRWLA